MTPKSSASKSLWTLRGVIEIYYWNRYNCRRNVARKSHFGRWGVFSSILGMCVILIAFFPEMYTEVLETTGPRLRDLASGHEASLRNLGPILLRKSEVSARISEGQTVYTVIKVMPHTAHTTFCRNHPGQVCLPLIRNERGFARHIAITRRQAGIQIFTQMLLQVCHILHTVHVGVTEIWLYILYLDGGTEIWSE